MNLESEAFVGELRQLRERELKLARVMNAVEELVDRGLENSDATGLGLGDERAVESLKRLAWDPELMAWMDKLRQAGKAPIKRLYESNPPSHEHDEDTGE